MERKNKIINSFDYYWNCFVCEIVLRSTLRSPTVKLTLERSAKKNGS